MDIRKLNNLKLNDYTIKLEKYEKGRFKEEFNFVFALYKGNVKISEMFLHGKVFYGRKPYYKPWIEIAYDESISKEIIIPFLEAFLKMMPENSSAMIDYDFETYKLLLKEDVESTWIGKLFLRCGYRNLRNWYIPEGFKEGGPKVQGWK